jgi:hypothetical protein
LSDVSSARDEAADDVIKFIMRADPEPTGGVAADCAQERGTSIRFERTKDQAQVVSNAVTDDSGSPAKADSSCERAYEHFREGRDRLPKNQA